jgi:hypothetical protein
MKKIFVMLLWLLPLLVRAHIGSPDVFLTATSVPGRRMS